MKRYIWPLTVLLIAAMGASTALALVHPEWGPGIGGAWITGLIVVAVLFFWAYLI